MAERRMFAKTIITSDAFMDMPIGSRLLYFYLMASADDDGFVNNPKSIMRQVGCASDDMNALISRKFVLIFDDGVVVIKHWRIHNYIQKDRYNETKYIEHKNELTLDEKKAYTMVKNDSCIQNVSKVDTQVRIGKVSIDKNIKDICMVKQKRFTPPTLEEVTNYCTERGNSVNPNKFIDFYESKDWFVGRTKMKDWKASVRTWEYRDNNNSKGKNVEMPKDAKKKINIDDIL